MTHLELLFGAAGGITIHWPPRVRTDRLQALILDPLSAQAHYNLASIFELDGDFDSALDHYRQALIADPRLADKTFNPHAKESQVLLAALLSIYRDAIGAIALDPGQIDASDRSN